MASEYFGYNRNTLDAAFPGNITVGTSSGSTDMELRIDTGKNLTKKDIITFLDALKVYLLSQSPTLATVDIPPL